MQIDRRNDLSLKLLEVFGAVMDQGTTTDAAEYLGVSQPAVSNGIRSLEKQIGLPLFERAGRQLRPTEEARLLYVESQPIFGMLRRLASEVRELKHNRSGRIRVAATPPLGHTLLPHCLRELLQGRQKLKVHFIVQRRSQVLQAVEDGLAAIGFYLGSDVHEGLVTKQLGIAELVAAVPRDHPLSGRALLTPADLAQHPLIGLGSNIGKLVANAFETANVVYAPQIETRYSQTACTMVNAGLAVAVVDPYSVLMPPNLNIVARRFAPSTIIPATTVTRRNMPANKLTGLLVDLLTRQIRNAPTTPRF
jgi:DNA-binding transcriptional LysR family regulator